MENHDVFVFQYVDCIYESGAETISLHLTKKGAYRAMNNYLNEKFDRWRKDKELYGSRKDWNPFEGQAWHITKFKVED